MPPSWILIYEGEILLQKTKGGKLHEKRGNGFPGLYCLANRYVNYYSATGELIETQLMDPDLTGTGGSCPTPAAVVYTLGEKPAYVTTDVIFSILGSFPSSETIEIVGTFTEND